MWCGRQFGKRRLFKWSSSHGNSVYIWDDYENYNSSSKFLEKQAIKDKNLVTTNGIASIEFTKLILEMIEFVTHENIEKNWCIWINMGFIIIVRNMGTLI